MRGNEHLSNGSSLNNDPHHRFSPSAAFTHTPTLDRGPHQLPDGTTFIIDRGFENPIENGNQPASPEVVPSPDNSFLTIWQRARGIVQGIGETAQKDYPDSIVTTQIKGIHVETCDTLFDALEVESPTLLPVPQEQYTPQPPVAAEQPKKKNRLPFSHLATKIAAPFIAGALIFGGRSEAKPFNTPLTSSTDYNPLDIQPDLTTGTYCELGQDIDTQTIWAAKQKGVDPITGAPIVSKLANSSYQDTTISCLGDVVAWGGQNGNIGEISYINTTTNQIDTFTQVPGVVNKVIVAPNNQIYVVWFTPGVNQIPATTIGLYDIATKTLQQGTVVYSNNDAVATVAFAPLNPDDGILQTYSSAGDHYGYDKVTFDGTKITVDHVPVSDTLLFRGVETTTYNTSTLVQTIAAGTTGDPTFGNNPNHGVSTENLDFIQNDGTIFHTTDQPRESIANTYIPPSSTNQGLFADVILTTPDNIVYSANQQAYESGNSPLYRTVYLERTTYDPSTHQVSLQHDNITPTQGDGSDFPYQDPTSPYGGNSITAKNMVTYPFNGPHGLKQEIVLTVQKDNYRLITPGTYAEFAATGSGSFWFNPDTGKYTRITVTADINITPSPTVTSTETVPNTVTPTDTPVSNTIPETPTPTETSVSSTIPVTPTVTDTPVSGTIPETPTSTPDRKYKVILPLVFK